MRHSHVFVALCVWVVGACVAAGHSDQEGQDVAPDDTQPVLRVEVHLMASCPLAREALRGLVPVLWQLGPSAQLRLHHIGGVFASGRLDSMYGDADLTLGRRQACAAELGGNPALLHVLQCQIEAQDSAASKCTGGPSLDTARLDACTEGAEGEALIRASFERSRKAAQRASPTIFVNGQPYRGGHSTQHFAHAFCANEALAPARFCRTLPAPVDVEVTLVKNSECVHPGCDTAAFERFVHQRFAGARLSIVDASNEQAEPLRALAGYPSLPFALFSPTARDDGYGFRAIEEHLRSIEGDHRLFLPLAGP